MMMKSQNRGLGSLKMPSLQVTVGMRWPASRNVKAPCFVLPIRAPHTILKSTVHHRTLIVRVELHRRLAAVSPTFRAADSQHFFELLSRALRRCGSTFGKVIDSLMTNIFQF